MNIEIGDEEDRIRIARINKNCQEENERIRLAHEYNNRMAKKKDEDTAWGYLISVLIIFVLMCMFKS